MARPTPEQAALVPFPPYRAKRVLDLALLVVVAIPATCVGAVCAVAVRLTSPGPALFRQERIGMAGVPFEVLKFRTMRTGVNPTFPDADRITRVGAVLRRFSLDELPQIAHVASGKMSLVGPRPPLPSEVNRYPEDVRRRLLVKPGLTGLWQVSGRADLPWAESVRLDLYYVDNWSLSMDFVIILKTTAAVLQGRGAY